MTEGFRCHQFAMMDALQAKLDAVNTERRETCSLKRDDRGEANGDHHVHENEAQILMQRISVIRERIANATSCPQPTTCESVCIGHVVTIRRTDTNRSAGVERHTFHIVGFEEGDPMQIPPQISYTTPIAELLLGGVIGEEVSGIIARTEKSYVIEDIAIPNAPTPELPLMKAVG
jgi:transcription elongation GreA/GreB family factor